MDGSPRHETRWTAVARWEELERRGRMVVRPAGRQIALFLQNGRLFACNNNCPHEGYPLSEGTLAESGEGHCLLTCNWHNWKFDLESGETLIGGDRLRRYPLRRAGEAVEIDLSEPPPAERRAAALAELQEALPEEDYDRMARALARLQAAGGEADDALRCVLAATHDRLEFGLGHAHASAPDWLDLGARFAADPAEALVPPLEVVAYLGEVSLRQPRFPYAAAAAPWDAAAFLAALEAEDEPAALARLRGALAEGLPLDRLWPVLARAALAHYADFGHSLIYCQKTAELVARLGAAAAEPLLLALVRSLAVASREDLLPEFRAYAPSLAAWDGKGAAVPDPARLLDGSVKRCLGLAVGASGRAEALHRVLLRALVRQLLCFDPAVEQRNDRPVSQNAGWLDVTHGITFANAVRWAAAQDPSLLPAGLLQMACFVGRNNALWDRALDPAPWRPDDAAVYMARSGRALLNHAETEFIVAAHCAKLWTATEREALAVADEPDLALDLVAALRRFLSSPHRRKHPLRTARQALSLVAGEA